MKTLLPSPRVSKGDELWLLLFSGNNNNDYSLKRTITLYITKRRTDHWIRTKEESIWLGTLVYTVKTVHECFGSPGPEVPNWEDRGWIHPFFPNQPQWSGLRTSKGISNPLPVFTLKSQNVSVDSPFYHCWKWFLSKILLPFQLKPLLLITHIFSLRIHLQSHREGLKFLPWTSFVLSFRWYTKDNYSNILYIIYILFTVHV